MTEEQKKFETPGGAGDSQVPALITSDGAMSLFFNAARFELAQRVANLIEHLYLSEIKTMDYPFKKLTLLLSTHSAISNGYVTLAPRRSEWYATPFQLGSDDGDWYELLATHEMRHVAQYGKLANRGINKIWKIYRKYNYDFWCYYANIFTCPTSI